MAPDRLRLLALVVVLAGLLVSPPSAAGESPVVSSATPDDPATDHRPGAHLAGIVAVQDGEIRGTVDRETFQARVANASSDRERVALIADRLNGTEQRLVALETRLRALERARDNGSIDADTYTARVATLGATADRLVAAANGTARAAARLPAEDRSSLNVSDRVGDIRSRAGAVRDRASEATAAIDGVDGRTRAAPLSRADIEEATTRVFRLPTSLRDLAGSERINLHVRLANGTTTVFAVETQDGRVRAVDTEPFESPTLVVYTDYQVIREIQRTDDPAVAVESAVDDDRIRYDGQGVGTSLKYGTLKLVTLLGGALLWLIPLVRG